MSSRSATGSRDDWQTPPAILDRVRRVAPIAFDPCTAPSNPVGAGAYVTPPFDGLAEDWREGVAGGGGGLVFVNPPYAAAAAWAAKVVEEAARGLQIVSLVAARVEAGWFAKLAWDGAQAVCFWRGRVRFIDADTGKPAMAWSKRELKWKPASAGFPSALVYHGRRPWAFEAAFADAGKVVRLP